LRDQSVPLAERWQYALAELAALAGEPAPGRRAFWKR
jgi:hypothetical protein